MFSGKYKVLSNNRWSKDNFHLVPIRYSDMFNIMKWRNEQLYHLRQSKPLTEEDQKIYFDTVVSELFDQDYPNQILFSYLDNGKLIGYGGLVHINWTDRNAEISFLMDTALEEKSFSFHWCTFLYIIGQVAFGELGLHKIYTYAFDLRPKLYVALENAGFEHEATLKEHCFFDGKFIDVLYHSKLDKPYLRCITTNDLEITFKWLNDPNIRQFSFNQRKISKDEHLRWFNQKLNDNNCLYYILESSLGNPLGSIRIDIEDGKGLISYLIDSGHFGKGLGTMILQLVEKKIIEKKVVLDQLYGYVLKENHASIKIFRKLGYELFEENNSLKFYKNLK